MSTSRVGAEAVLLRTGKVVIVGGHNWTNIPRTLGTAELFDPSTGTFGPLHKCGLEMNDAREYPTVLVGNGEGLIAGGYKWDEQGLADNGLKTAELYNPISKRF
jgi:hypothetical protein